MKIEEMIKVMEHYADGGDVEYSINKFKTVLGISNIKKGGDLRWDWQTFNYRIKEQKQNVTIEKWLGRDNKGDFIILEASNVDKYKGYELVKLLESYEVEL